MNTTSNKWDTVYKLAEQYFMENGDLLVPRSCTYEGINLGRWINTQRCTYNNGKLSKERIDKLNKIEMVWDASDFQYLNRKKYDEAHWNAIYVHAKEYYEKQGDLFIPRNFVVDGIRLGRWINTQRTYYNNQTLSADRIHKLELIGICWDATAYKGKLRQRGLDQLWQERFRHAEAYYLRYGNLNVPKDYKNKETDFDLRTWLISQRRAYKNNLLAEHKIEQLNSLGFKWHPMVCKSTQEDLE